jgi:hypothetical protein
MVFAPGLNGGPHENPWGEGKNGNEKGRDLKFY